MNKVQWRVLPTKANQDMEQAGADAAREYLERTGSNSLFAIYEAMVLAAPTPPHVEDDEVCGSLPTPVDDSELPVVGEATYDAWDMAQQWNGCREAFLPVVMRLQAERNAYRDALSLIGQGLAVVDGAKNPDAIREEIHELQERDLDQLSLLIEAKEALQRLAASEKLRGSTSSAAELEVLAEKIVANSIAPITDGAQPLSRLALQRELERLKAQVAQARSLLHVASVHLSRWVGIDDAPRQQIIEFLDGIGAPVERDERAAFERFCVDSFNRSCNPRIPMKMELMLAARRGENYSATGWTEMWKGWKARAVLDQSGALVLSQTGEVPLNG